MTDCEGAVCVRCGRSALGRATDGQQYCHRPECIDWKAERIKAAAQRALAGRTIV